jgi:hypothetical protein
MDEFNVAEDLSTYSVEDIDNLITQGNERLDEIFAKANWTDEEVVEAERIDAAVKDLGAEKQHRVTAASQRVERMSALKDARVTAAEDDLAVANDTQADDDEEEAEEEADDSEVEATVETPEKEKAVTASAPNVIVRKPRPVVPETPAKKVSIIASADIPDFTTGSEIGTLERLADAVASRAKGMPVFTGGTAGGTLQKYPVATIRRGFEDDLVAKGNGDVTEVLDRAGDEKRLPGGSLTAAGGWCAPSQTLYDFCAGESLDGLWDVPEIQVTRGGINFTMGPQFSDFYGQDFTQTEAQAIAGTDKTCYTITCPTFTDVRLDATGLCIKLPILTNAAYPELTQRITSGMLTAHQHKISSNLIVKALAIAAAVTPATIGGTVSDSLAALELQAETLRGVYRLPLAQTMEVVVPYWVRAAMRADLANRNGVDMLAISDQQLQSYFSARKLNVQWVYNWQPLVENEEGYPATFVALIYPSGTFVKGTSDVITLSNVYDAASLVENEYTGLFTEEGILLANRCYKAKKVTIPLCQAGKTGIANLAACFTLTP